MEPVSDVHLCILQICLGGVVCFCRPSRVRGGDLRGGSEDDFFVAMRCGALYV